MDVFSGLSGIYDTLVGDNSRYYDAILSSLQARYPGLRDATVADIGGGTGLFTFHACDRIKSILLIDPSAEMLKEAKAKRSRSACENVEIRKGGLPGCGLDKDSVDAIVVIGAFQYLPREREPAALREIYRSLKPGGLVFIDLTEHTFPGRKRAGPEIREFNVRGRKIVERSSRAVYPGGNEWVDSYHVTVENPENGKVTEFESRHVLQRLSPDEMRLMLGRAGFSGVEIVRQPYGNDTYKTWCFAAKLIS